MEEINIQDLKQKTTTSIFFLSLRNFGIQAISTVGFFLLTILLGTGEVGLFAIVAESVGILGYFSDVGLASALIQQKEKIKKEELQTTFLIQQTLVILSLVGVAIFYSHFSQSRGYGPKEFWILISLCFSFVAASLKTIPSVQLERNLNFKLFSIIDIAENITFYFFAVLFAFLGFEGYSYAIAIFIRSTLGLILMYHYSPWPIGFSFSIVSAKKLFKFGIPFQLNSFIALAKDRLSNLLVAGIIGREAFGILSWAQKGPRIPLSFMDAVMKVTFPTFSRIQDEADILKRSIEKSIFFISFLVFPSLVGIALLAPDIINFIPKYSKWMPAVLPLYFYAINAAIASVTTPLTNAFNAVGKITTTTKLMIMWTVLTWIFYPILSSRFGYLGTAVASLIVGSSSFVVWVLAYKIFHVSVIKNIANPLIGTFFMSIFIFALDYTNLPLIILIPTKILFGISTYLLIQLLLSSSQINWFLGQLKIIKNRKKISLAST